MGEHRRNPALEPEASEADLIKFRKLVAAASVYASTGSRSALVRLSKTAARAAKAQLPISQRNLKSPLYRLTLLGKAVAGFQPAQRKDAQAEMAGLVRDLEAVPLVGLGQSSAPPREPRKDIFG